MKERGVTRVLFEVAGRVAALRHRLRRDVDLDDWMLFIHVPKTGGTSFRIAAERRLRGRILFDYGPNSAETSQEIHRHVHEQRDLAVLAEVIAERRVGMVCGHFPYGRYRSLIDPERVVVFLREPCQRVVSEYHHYRRHHDFDGTLLEFARRPSHRNLQWRMVRGLDLQRAALVGLSEYYHESLRLLARTTGLTLSGLQLNANPERTDTALYELDEGEEAALRELNAEDILLYRRVVENFAVATETTIEPPAGSPDATHEPLSSASSPGKP